MFNHSEAGCLSLEVLAAAETEVLIPGTVSCGPGRSNRRRAQFRRAGQARVRLRGQHQGKTIAITGAARGIGFKLRRRRCCWRGARVVIGDRDVAMEESAVAKLRQPRAGVGLSPRRHRRGVLRHLPGQGPRRRRAGVSTSWSTTPRHAHRPFLDASEQAIRSTIEVNLYGVISGCRLVLPEMVARRDGHVVNIASMAGMLATPALYCRSNSPSWAHHRPVRRVRAAETSRSAVMPTFTNTELITGTATGGMTPKPVEPGDIAAAVVRTLDKPKSSVAVPGVYRHRHGPLRSCRPGAAAIVREDGTSRYS